MGASKYIRQSFTETQGSQIYKARLRVWRQGHSMERVEKPLNPARARELGYKAKPGYFVVRVKTKRGKRVRNRPAIGRKPGKNRKRENPGKPWQWFAEQKAMLKHKNAAVVGSYFVGADGERQYFEVILKTKQ